MIVTLSRQLGSEGDAIATQVAAELHLLVVDRDYVYAAALKTGVPENRLRQLMHEGRRSLAREIVDSLGKSTSGTETTNRPPQHPIGGVFAPLLGPEQVSLEDAARTVGAAIRDLAGSKDVLVLGQGSQVLLRDAPGACHVQVVAPLDWRARRIVTLDGVTLATARRRARASDQARSDYLARYHGVNWLDPLLYHLIINTGQMPVEVAVSLVVHAARTLCQNASSGPHL
jgi:cytidylate kinase